MNQRALPLAALPLAALPLVALLPAVLLPAVGLSAQVAPHGHGSRPNVILILTDDQGYGDIGYNGNPVLRTPNLDRLASDSVRFTDFHASPMCAPSRGQLMTGVDALRNGAMNVSSGRALLRREYTTLADLMRAGGYATGIFGKWHLGDNYPFRPQDRGFDEAVYFRSSYINALPNEWDSDYFDDVYLHNGEPQAFEGYTTDVLFAQAMQWMGRKADAGERFFCYLPTAAAHAPLFVPERYRLAAEKRLAKAMPDLDVSDKVRRSLARFLAMIENLDDNLGRLEQFLRKRQLRDNTIVLFLTDNGSTMGPRYYNAGMRGRKTTLWEGGHHVPLFIRWPNGALGPPRDVGALTEEQDLLPTLCDLCGLQQPADMAIDGTSLDSLLRGDPTSFPDRMLVVHYSRMPFGFPRPAENMPSRPTRDGAAVLWRHWRMLEDKALYDLDADPHQDHDVADQHPEIAAAMRRHLYAWWEGVAPRVNEPSRIIIGSEHENPTKLTACDWFDTFVDQQYQVRRLAAKFGAWELEIARPGRYRVELRRWPREAGFAIGQAIPATEVTDGTFAAGVAMPVARARLQVGGYDHTIDVAEDAAAAIFECRLQPGPGRMQSWFLDAGGKELTAAYYAYVTRL